jgi:competence protein ComEC
MNATFNRISVSNSKTLISFCFCFILGVAFASFFSFPNQISEFFIYATIIGLLFFIAYFWRDKKIRLFFLIMAGLLFGFLRYNSFFLNTPPLPKEKILLTARVVQDPSIRTKNISYVIKSEKFSQKFLVYLPLSTDYRYGDTIKIWCDLQKPDNNFADGFKYDMFLSAQGITAICNSPKIVSDEKKIEARQSFLQIIFSPIYKLKYITAKQVKKLWPEPESALIGGLLYGERASFPKDLSDNFNRVGLTHIIAVSGFNISIIASFFMYILIAVGLNRRQAFWISVIGIGAFVFFCGAPASAVRAGIMGSIVLLGQYLGRPSQAVRALFFTIFLIVLFNPLSLIWDAGFQLSAIATAGLLYLPPIIKERFLNLAPINNLPKIKLFLEKSAIAEILFATFSAIVATLPLILFQFGRLSVVALPVNLLVLWLIPYIMLFGFLAVIIGWIFYPAGLVIAWFTGFGLKYIIFISDYLGSLSWSSIEMKIPWWAMVMMYLFLFYCVRVYQQSNQNKSRNN